MTKQLYRLATALQQRLLHGPWPPKERVVVDGWASLVAWHDAGEPMFRLRGHPPPIDPDLPLATAPVRAGGLCYILARAEWIVVARHAPLEPVRVQAPHRVIQYRDPVLTYATEADGLAAGYINLRDQPTPRHLVLLAGTKTDTLGRRRLDREEISVEAVRLAQVIPWYYAITAG